MLRYAVLIVAGCNQVYGLDPTRLPEEAGRFPVTGQLTHVWVENDASGNPKLLEAPMPQTTDLYVSVRSGDTETDVDVDAGGNFTFMRAEEDEPYVLVVTSDGEVLEIQHDVAHLNYVIRTAGRLDPEPVLDPLFITFPVTAGATGIVASTGLWSNKAEGAFAGSYTIDWQKAASGASRHGLVDSRRGDVLYNMELAKRTSPEGLEYQTVVAARRNDVVMTGAGFSLPSASPVTPQACSKLVGPLDREANRLGPTTKLYAREFETWGIVALPSHETAVAGGVAIASGIRLGTPAPLGISQDVYNPIAGSSLVATATTSLYRFYRHPDASYYSVQRELLSFVTPIDCAAPTTTVVPAESVAIPANPRLEGVPLDQDEVGVPLPDERTADLELAWDLGSPGRVDYYTITLYEVRRNEFAETRTTVVRSYQTPAQQISISQTGLIRGRYYMVEITALAGFPGARDGDLRPFEYPFAAALTASSMFRLR